ncbi:uncharacterized protein KQ657_000416 [Scheffersomyces spartinae]|uniref:Uncharacterized protein n=1 Tax=Scheffersomyces spartinae TaxID=45513 RepID=A0A9P8AIG9_9ASCO|nr:uncharacterized protein KQ657_000416 [Scheffersomyces spartinae]KAG7193725.1 hypothetical protein KQ657_000416 [Scheffersomyces spartinae]
MHFLYQAGKHIKDNEQLMEKLNPLLPFAYSGSSTTNELALDTTPRNRSEIDENAASSYHTRVTTPTINIRRPKGPRLKHVPTLKRKMGDSFSENDNIKRRVVNDDENTSSEGETSLLASFYDSNRNNTTNINNRLQKEALKKETPPSSPPPAAISLVSEYDFFTNPTQSFHIPDSPRVIDPSSEANTEIEEEFEPEKVVATRPKLYGRHKEDVPSSEVDFGIDKFNRFKYPSIHEQFSTDGDIDRTNYENEREANFERAKRKLLYAFENVETTIDLEDMGLYDVPDEIKDFDKLVIFESGSVSYQLYLANNHIRHLPPSIFKFTKLNVLSIRHNKLRYIPSLIHKLKNLTDLSIGANDLKYLCPQILDLKNLTTLGAGPNPFIKVTPDAKYVTTSKKHPIDSTRRLNYISPIIYTVEDPGNPAYKLPSFKALALNEIGKYDVTYGETKIPVVQLDGKII